MLLGGIVVGMIFLVQLPILVSVWCCCAVIGCVIGMVVVLSVALFCYGYVLVLLPLMLLVVDAICYWYVYCY